MYIYLTSFGKFGNILENPTTHLAKDLNKKLQDGYCIDENICIEHIEVVTVSIQDCESAL